MKINGVEVKGIKETIGKYNKMTTSERMSFNIWFDNMEKRVILIRNDIFEQCGMDTERYTDKETGLSFLRYDDISYIINDRYPENYKISMITIQAVIGEYLI